MSKPIIVAGIELTEERFPHLYRIANQSPAMLEAQLRYFSQVDNPTKDDLWSAAVIFEMDLEHG